MNPAVTLAAALTRGLPWHTVPAYILAHVAVAIIGACDVRVASAVAFDTRPHWRRSYERDDVYTALSKLVRGVAEASLIGVWPSYIYRSTQNAGMPQRIATGLRPDRQAVWLGTHGNLAYVAVLGVDDVDHVVEAARQP